MAYAEIDLMVFGRYFDICLDSNQLALIINEPKKIKTFEVGRVLYRFFVEYLQISQYRTRVLIAKNKQALYNSDKVIQFLNKNQLNYFVKGSSIYSLIGMTYIQNGFESTFEALSDLFEINHKGYRKTAYTKLNLRFCASLFNLLAHIEGKTIDLDSTLPNNLFRRANQILEGCHRYSNCNDVRLKKILGHIFIYKGWDACLNFYKEVQAA